MARKRRRPAPPAPANDLIAIGEIDRLAKRVKAFIWAVGAVLALLFTWLQFKDLPFGHMIESTQTGTILRFVLAIYYSCWIFGAGFNVSIQQGVYINDPHRGRLPVEAYLILVSFAIVAAILFATSTNNQYFAAALTGFVIMNVVGWLYICHRVKPIIASSKRYIEARDFFSLERLNVVVHYMTGSWQRHRFIVMFAMVIIADVIVFVPFVREPIASQLHARVQTASLSAIDRVIPELAFAVFVLVGETWIMAMRMQTRSLVDVIDKLRTKYLLTPSQQ